MRPHPLNTCLSPLRVRRITLGITQKELGAVVRRSGTWVHHLENGMGGAAASAHEKAAIATFLNLPVEELFKPKPPRHTTIFDPPARKKEDR